MSFAFLAFYTGDYLRDTPHLSCCEHGIYLKLLFYCWDQRGPVPLDERRQCGIVNARSGDEVEALRRVLGEFFVAMDDGYYNLRMQREIERADALATQRQDFGRRGANERMRRFRASQASAKQVLSTSQADAKQVTLPPPPPPPPPLPLQPKSEATAQSLPAKPAGNSTQELIDPPILTIPLVGQQGEYAVHQVMIDEWQQLYPAVDVLGTLRQIRGWSIANPTRRKTPRGILRHINGWLSREQDK